MPQPQPPDHAQPGEPPDHAHETTIVVNAQVKTITTKEITFEQVVDLAYDGNPPQGENWVFTVTYRRGADESPQGSLVKGANVKVKKSKASTRPVICSCSTGRLSARTICAGSPRSTSVRCGLVLLMRCLDRGGRLPGGARRCLSSTQIVS